MSSASKVGEIFSAAGTAFTKLGELTMQLHTAGGVGGSTKWTEEDITMMHHCITKFASEIDEISSRVRLRTTTHINSTIKKREYEGAGLVPPPALNSTSSPILSTTSFSSHTTGSSLKGNRRGGKKSLSTSTPSHLLSVSSSISSSHSQDVTLNMLNASSDGDVDLKMDFESSTSSS